MSQLMINDDHALMDGRFVPNVNESVVNNRRSFLGKLAQPLVLVLILLLAFALRVYALEGQSMWSDEGLSLYRARQQPADILEGLIIIDGVETRDTNPPFYFLLLSLLRAAAGESIFALRYAGVLAGILAIPLIYVLGTAAYGKQVGLTAAFLLAISPFHVWQSQVMRNYSLLLTLNLASVYGLFRYALSGSRSADWRWLVLWAVAGLLGIYTHYFGFFVFAFGFLALAILILRRQGIKALARQRRSWIILGGVLIILLPAVFVAFGRFAAGRQFDFHPVSLLQITNHALSGFSVGISPSLSHPWWLIIPALLLVLAGLLIGWWINRLSTILFIGYQIIPLGLLLLLSIINPLYNGVRHLLIGLPSFLVLVAVGVAGNVKINAQKSEYGQAWAIWRRVRFLPFILLFLVQAGWLYNQFNSPELIRDDIRGVAEYLNEFAGPKDLIILHDTIIGLTFDYYYDGAAPWLGIPALGEQNTDQAEEALQDAAAQAERIWFLVQPTPRTGFPRDLLRDWAEKNWPRFFSQEFPSMWLRVQLNGYTPQPVVSQIAQDAHPLAIEFDDTISLHGVQLPAEVKAGEPWWTTFYWSQAQEEAKEVILSLRLVDQDGRLWRQMDELLWHEYLDHHWPTGSILRKDYEKTIASGLPPGEYDLRLRVLDLDRRPIPAADGQIDHFLGKIQVEAGTDMARLPSFIPQRARMGDVDLLGFNLPSDDIRPGHGIPFEFFWRVRETPAQDYQVRTRLFDPTGNIAAEAINLPTNANYPMTQWRADELLQSKFQMLMPGNVEIVPHKVEVALVDPSNGQSVAAVILNEQLTADPWPYVANLPPDINALNAEIGQPPSISLRGYELFSDDINPGDAVEFTLYWQALADVPQAYYVFIHLISEDGDIVAQFDGAPVQGFRPTLSWRKGEVIEDGYVLPTNSELPPGTYRLWAGMYHPGTGERPAVAVNGQMTDDNRVLIQEITVR
jgi:mannosyltransferase